MPIKAILFAIFIVTGVVIVGAIVTGLTFAGSIRSDIAHAIAATHRPSDVVAAETLLALPTPVQRYLTWSGVVGRSVPRVVRVEKDGRIRGAADAKWMNFKAGENYTTDPPAFVWWAWFPEPRLPIVFGRDEYLNGKGSIVMRALGVFPVADEYGEQFGAAGLMRFLNEMMWFPAAFTAKNVKWRAIDDTSAKVTLSDRGITAIATMVFDDEGKPVTFRARRFNTPSSRGRHR